MKAWLWTSLVVFGAGCASPSFRPYVGSQQEWPIAPGSLVSLQAELPILMCLPPAPYEVVGEMRVERARPQERHLQALAVLAKKKGADALLLVDGPAFFSASYGAPHPVHSASLRTEPVRTAVVKSAPFSGFRGGGGNLSRATITVFDRRTVIVAIRWRGEPPPGLPAQHAPLVAGR